MSMRRNKKQPDPRIVYADIIDMPHWQSPTRSHMSLYDRAAQFSAYKALTGFEDMITEASRKIGDEGERGEAYEAEGNIESW